MHPPSTPASQVFSLTPSPDREITHYSQAGFFRKSIPPKRKWGGGLYGISHYLCTIKRKKGLGELEPLQSLSKSQ